MPLGGVSCHADCEGAELWRNREDDQVVGGVQRKQQQNHRNSKRVGEGGKNNDTRDRRGDELAMDCVVESERYTGPG